MQKKQWYKRGLTYQLIVFVGVWSHHFFSMATPPQDPTSNGFLLVFSLILWLPLAALIFLLDFGLTTLAAKDASDLRSTMGFIALFLGAALVVGILKIFFTV